MTLTIARKPITLAGSGGATEFRRRVPMDMTTEPPPPPPPPSETVTQDMLDFMAAAMAAPEGSHSSGIDAGARREMLAAVALAPRTEATHVAVQDGDWDDPTTWIEVAEEEFGVPGTGAKAFIPEGVSVTYEYQSNDALTWLRLDGDLHFHGDCLLRVDTIICDHHSHFSIGHDDHPIAADKAVIIEFPDGGNIDTTADPLLMSRGIVSMSHHVHIYGAPKTPWYRVTQARSIGATTITLPETPSGWRVGDSITITSTRCPNCTYDGSRLHLNKFDDHATITAIDGSTITFDPPLANARVDRRQTDFDEVGYYVANFTRNVVFRSPADTPVHRRGHLMFMHADMHIHYAQSDWLGRTRKDVVSFLATDDAARQAQNGSGQPWAATSNVRGRYNWHLHKPGSEVGAPRASMLGCAASHAPGWLYSHHSGIMDMEWNVGRFFLGAGIMMEDGDEVGIWSNNLMCSQLGGVESTFPAETDREKDNSSARDFGKFGSAYWFAGRVIFFEDNVAADCFTGAVWMHRGTGASPRVQNTPEPRAFYAGANASLSIAADKPFISPVRRNRFHSLMTGFVVVKANSNQGHDARSEFLDNTTWECRKGFLVQYTAHYSFMNQKFLRAASIPTRNGSNLSTEVVHIGNASVDMVFRNLIGRGGFGTGVGFSNNMHFHDTPDAEYVFIDFDHDGGNRFSANGSYTGGTTQADFIKDLTAAATSEATLTYTPPGELVWPMFNAGAWNANLVFTGTKTSGLGTRTRWFSSVNSEWRRASSFAKSDVTAMLQTYGYWTHGGANFLLVPDVIYDRIHHSDGTFRKRYLTIPVRLVSDYSITGITNRGAMPQRYVDCRLIGQGNPPGSPHPNAAAWVVYEDILAPGFDMSTGYDES